MKTLMIIAFAGAMLTSVSVAGMNDQWSEERSKAKTGRYSPAEEPRRMELARGAGQTATDCYEACCRREQSTSASTRAEEFLRAKLDRSDATAASQREEHHAERGEPSSGAVWQRAKFGRVLSKTADEHTARQSTAGVAVCHLCARSSCCDEEPESGIWAGLPAGPDLLLNKND